MTPSISIVWLRQDLRLTDNPALAHAAKSGIVLPVYILDDSAPEPFKLGTASKIWLHNSLTSLNRSLDGQLNVYRGKASEIIEQLITAYPVTNLFFNRCYEPWHVKQAAAVKKICSEKSVVCQEYNGNYLWRPDQVLKDDGTYYRVFTAYKRKAYTVPARHIIEQKLQIDLLADHYNTTTIADLNLISSDTKWAEKQLMTQWTVGETAAQKKLVAFVKNKLSGYKDGRNYPGKNQPSMLSPHLHFGEISPAQVWLAVEKHGPAYANATDRESFLNELIWRDFSSYLLYYFQSLHKDNFNADFDAFPWEKNLSHLRAWQTGNTGYPIVDAGMRQLWQTGYMHNRVRMITASFLVKNLNIHWHKGRDWFWDCLLDADLANNSASWQWVAGCGVDPAPYFRIFNPVTQGEKFDKHGDYIKKFVPELQKLPDKYLCKPWTAPEEILQAAGVILGKDYPRPIVDLADTRKKALAAYKTL
jgi:deoxyribodipyrimidine photo-lyase